MTAATLQDLFRPRIVVPGRRWVDGLIDRYLTGKYKSGQPVHSSTPYHPAYGCSPSGFTYYNARNCTDLRYSSIWLPAASVPTSGTFYFKYSGVCYSIDRSSGSNSPSGTIVSSGWTTQTSCCVCLNNCCTACGINVFTISFSGVTWGSNSGWSCTPSFSTLNIPATFQSASQCQGFLGGLSFNCGANGTWSAQCIVSWDSSGAYHINLSTATPFTINWFVGANGTYSCGSPGVVNNNLTGVGGSAVVSVS